ncbi:restriction endonuclease subunit S [Thomasclavelia cocleata]|uniref:restriction endonuclease subunit S n=1 Tax=Thomasclavelia cocleata TaxID=69824 RepID=UPI0035122B2E
MNINRTKMSLIDYIEMNPRETIAKGCIAKKIGMDKLQPFCRDILEYELAEFNGGSKFRNGDTIMARITPCLENGKTAMVTILDENEVGFGSTEYIVFRAKKGWTIPNFVYYLVCSSVVRELAIKSMVGSSGRQRVQTDIVANLEINFPSLDKQTRISSILKSLDDKIALNNKINNNLEHQMETLFRSLFVENVNSAWQEGVLSDLGTIVAGGTPSKAKPEYYAEHGIAWITPKDLSLNKSKFISNGENDISELGFSKSSTTKMPAGTVLFSSRAPIGYIAIAANELTTNQGFKSVVPNENIGTAFMYFLLKWLLPTIERMASGSTFKEISGTGMKSVPVVIPDDKTIAQFNDFCSPIFQQQEILEAENIRLSNIRDALLPKLMSGELDVSDIDL